jgi:hypothetical protein
MSESGVHSWPTDPIGPTKVSDGEAPEIGDRLQGRPTF